MRIPGKLSIWKFFMYIVIGTILGGIIMGTISYFIAVPRGGNINLSVYIGAIFGAFFGGPLVASNLEKEK